MSLESATNTLRARVGSNSGLGAVLKYNCDGDGVVVIDGRSNPNTVTNNDRSADCTVQIALYNLEAMLSGSLTLNVALLNGQARLTGNAIVAMQMQTLM